MTPALVLSKRSRRSVGTPDGVLDKTSDEEMYCTRRYTLLLPVSHTSRVSAVGVSTPVHA